MKRDRKSLTSRRKPRGFREREHAQYGYQTFRNAVENASDFIYLIDKKGEALSVNKSAAALFGRTPEEIEGKSIFDIFPKDVATRFSEHLRQVFKTGKGELNHESMMVVGGKEFCTNVHLNPVTDKEGRVLAVLGVTRDITEQKQMEKALRQSEDKFRNIAERSVDAVAIVSPEGTITYMSPAAERIFQYKPEEMVGKPIQNFHPESEIPKLTKVFTETLETGRMEGAPLETLRKDGSHGYIEVSASTTYVDGKIAAVQSILRDITERKRMEEELRRYSTSLEQMVAERTGKLAESERRFRELANLLPEIVFEIDVRGNYTFINRSGIVAGGYTEEEVYSGLNAVQTFIEADREKIKKSIERILSGKSVHPHEFTALRKDGTTFPVLIHSAAIIHEGKPVGIRGVAMDMTERKRMEEAVRVSEERFRGIAERSIDGIFEMDLEGRLTYVSPSVEPALGYKPEEVVGTNIERYLPEFEIPKIATHMELLMQGKNVLALEGEMLRKDGTRVPAELNASSIFKDGKVVGVQGIVRDITERKRAEKELRQSEIRFRELAELLPQIVFETDETGVFTFVNHVGLVSTGYTEDDLHSNPANLLQLVSPDEYGKVLESLARRNEREPISLELKVCRKDGSVFPALVYAGAIVRERKIVGFRGIVVDITERKRIEQDLQEAKERLEYVIESNPAVIYLAKPLSDFSDYYATYKSKNVVSLTGFESEEFIGEKGAALWASRVHPDDLASYIEGTAQFWKEGHRVCEYRFLHKNGTYRWIREEAKLIRDDKGNVRDIIGYWTDVTNRKEMEEEVLRSQRLAAIGETASMVAHDLRNPLQGITGAVHLLREEALTREERDEMLQLIHGSVEYSDSIVRDLLEYSGEIQLKPAETTTKTIIRDAIKTVKIPEKITVQDLSEDHEITADHGKMKRVLINLLENAIDAMPQGGTLTITSKQPDRMVEIAVSDTGPGMPEKVLENLWKPLQTTKAKGLGLGLAICKRVVDAHGGTICMKSKVGEGTTVTVRVPTTPRPVEVKEK